MQRRILGKTGLSVSPLGFGGAEIGFEQAGQDTVDRLLGAALDAGLNVIDTAALYMTSEEMIGRAVGHRRSEYVLMTKCAHPSEIARPGWVPDAITESLDRSLQRLSTETLDVVFLHSCPEALLREGAVIERLAAARQAGKVRYIGYSGDAATMVWAIESGAFDVIQTSVNVYDQQAIDLTVPAAAQRNLGVVAKRPIGNAVWRYTQTPPNPYHQTYYDRSQRLQYLWQSDPATAAATALRFTLSIPGVHTAIVGTANPQRWTANAALAAAGPLTADDYEAIRQRWREVATPDWVGQM